MERRLLRGDHEPGDDRDLGARPVARLGCRLLGEPVAHAKLVLVVRPVRGSWPVRRAARAISPTTGTAVSQRFYRIVNEVPTLLVIAIVILVVVKPF